MNEKFKKSNYIKIVRNLIGEYSGYEIDNDHYPTLKNIVLIEDDL